MPTEVYRNKRTGEIREVEVPAPSPGLGSEFWQSLWDPERRTTRMPLTVLTEGLARAAQPPPEARGLPGGRRPPRLHPYTGAPLQQQDIPTRAQELTDVLTEGLGAAATGGIFRGVRGFFRRPPRPGASLAPRARVRDAFVEDLRQLGVRATEAPTVADRILAEHPGETNPHVLVGAYFRQKAAERVKSPAASVEDVPWYGKAPERTREAAQPKPTDLAAMEMTPAEGAQRQHVVALRERNAKLKALNEAIEFNRGVPDLERVAELEAEKQALLSSVTSPAPARQTPAKGPILPAGPGTIGTLKLTGQAPSPQEPTTLPPLRKPLPPTGEWPADTSFAPRAEPSPTPEAPAAKPKTKAAKAAAEADVIVPEETAAALGLKRKRPKAFEPGIEDTVLADALAHGEHVEATFLRQAALEVADQIMTGGGGDPVKQGVASTLAQQLRRYALTGLETGEQGGQGLKRPWLREKLIARAKEIRGVEMEADETTRRALAVERLRRMRERKERLSFESFVDELAAESPGPEEAPKGIPILPGTLRPGVGSRMIGKAEDTPPPKGPVPPGAELTRGARETTAPPTTPPAEGIEGLVQQARALPPELRSSISGIQHRLRIKYERARQVRDALLQETSLPVQPPPPGTELTRGRRGKRGPVEQRTFEEAVRAGRMPDAYIKESFRASDEEIAALREGGGSSTPPPHRRRPIPPGQTAMFTTRETTPGITPGGLRPTAPQVEHDRLLEGFRQPKPSQQQGLPLGSPAARTNPALLRVVQEQLESGVTPSTLRSRVQRGDFPGITETELKQAIREVEQTAPVEQESPFTSLKADMMARAKAGNRQSLFMLYRLFRLRLPMVEKQLGITDADFKALNLSMFPSFMPSMA